MFEEFILNQYNDINVTLQLKELKSCLNKGEYYNSLVKNCEKAIPMKGMIWVSDNPKKLEVEFDRLIQPVMDIFSYFTYITIEGFTEYESLHFIV